MAANKRHRGYFQPALHESDINYRAATTMDEYRKQNIEKNPAF